MLPSIEGTGKGGRVTKEDVLNAVAQLEGQAGKTRSCGTMPRLTSAPLMMKD